MISLPPSFIEDIQQLLGEDEAGELINALDSSETEVSIRINSRKVKEPNNCCPQQDLIDREVEWCNTGFYLKERPKFTLDPLLHAGCYYVQEASSMFIQYILQYLNIERNARMLDLCAAPGGKSTLIADYLSDEGLLVCNEVIKTRAQILKENIIKWGSPNVVVCNSDPSAFSALNSVFDVAVVDAPCSGEGMFRKDLQARNEWSRSHVELCAQRQKRIIEDIWSTIKEDGYLIYSTCTFNSTENEDIVQWIVDTLEGESISIEHPFNTITSSINSSCHGYHFFPHKTKGEGLFVAVIRKTTGNEPSNKKGQKSKRNVKEQRPQLPAQYQQALNHFDDYALYTKKEIIGAVYKQHSSFITELEASVRIIYKGIEIAEIEGRKDRPQHALALSTLFNKEIYQPIELPLESALLFLKKEDIRIEQEGKGWRCVEYQTTPLGWIKQIGARNNNYYPKEWRILMNIK